MVASAWCGGGGDRGGGGGAQVVAPPECRGCYSESLALMPHCYFVNDYKQVRPRRRLPCRARHPLVLSVQEDSHYEGGLVRIFLRVRGGLSLRQGTRYTFARQFRSWVLEL